MKWGVGDAVKAFTQSEIDKLLYAEMPRGFEQEGMCLQILQSLEGSKQAAHLWQKMLSKALQEMGFTRSLVDPCFFSRTTQDGGFIMLIVWVDDYLYAYSHDKLADEFEAALQTHIKCTHARDVKKFIGMEIERDPCDRYRAGGARSQGGGVI